MSESQPLPNVLQLGAYAPSDESALARHVNLVRFFEIKDQANWLAEKGASIRAIATRGDLAVPESLVKSLPNLEMVAVYGVGYDGVDLAACKAQNVRVTNTPDVLTDDVADVAIGMMLSHYRGVIGADAWVRKNDWATQGGYPLKRSLKSLRCGVLGLGRIGQAVAHRAQAFGQTVAYSATAAKSDVPSDWTFFDNALDLAKETDVMFVTLAANEKTKHIVNADVIDALGPNGMVVNVSRAQNIDEIALLDALEAGTLGGAGLDVFEGEPVVNPRFFALENAVLQPHHGSATVETRAAMGQLVLDNLVAHFDNKSLLTPVI